MASIYPYIGVATYIFGHVLIRRLFRVPPASSSNATHEEVTQVDAPTASANEVPESCNDCVLANTVDSIDRHVYMCNPYVWPSKIESDESGFAGKFSRRVKQIRKGLPESTFSLRLTVCNSPSPSGYIDMFIFPENQMIRVPEGMAFSDMDDLIHELISPEMPFKCYSPQPLPFRQAFFVCEHAARDKRCGRAGPIVIEELRKQLAARNIPTNEIAVFGTSHIGGHKYAGTLIVYPQAQWYGYITKRLTAELVDSVCEGKVLNKCFRGKSNLQW